MRKLLILLSILIITSISNSKDIVSLNILNISEYYVYHENELYSIHKSENLGYYLEGFKLVVITHDFEKFILNLHNLNVKLVRKIDVNKFKVIECKHN